MKCVYIHFLGEGSNMAMHTDKKYLSQVFSFEIVENSNHLYYREKEQKCSKNLCKQSLCKLNI